VESLEERNTKTRDMARTSPVCRNTGETPMPGAIPVYTNREILYWLHPTTFKRIDTEPMLTEAEQLARSHEFADNDPTIAKCYFIGGDDGPIKIGYSISVKDRLRTLQLCSPIRLRVLATASGGMQRESAYHGQFAESRLHGEWFERTPGLLAEIERLKA
jgi:hypothetical protein